MRSAISCLNEAKISSAGKYGQLDVDATARLEVMKMTHTLQSMYQSHLRDTLGYTNGVVMDQVNPEMIRDVLSRMDRVKYDRWGIEQEVKLSVEIRQRHSGVLDAYATARQRLIKSSQELEKIIPKHLVWIEPDLGDRIVEISARYNSSLDQIKSCLEQIKYLRGEMARTPEPEKINQNYDQKILEVGLVQAMGLVWDPCLEADGISKTVSPGPLDFKVVESARWLVKKIERMNQRTGRTCLIEYWRGGENGDGDGDGERVPSQFAATG